MVRWLSGVWCHKLFIMLCFTTSRYFSYSTGCLCPRGSRAKWHKLTSAVTKPSFEKSSLMFALLRKIPTCVSQAPTQLLLFLTMLLWYLGHEGMDCLNMMCVWVIFCNLKKWNNGSDVWIRELYLFIELGSQPKSPSSYWGQPKSERSWDGKCEKERRKTVYFTNQFFVFTPLDCVRKYWAFLGQKPKRLKTGGVVFHQFF